MEYVSHWVLKSGKSAKRVVFDMIFKIIYLIVGYWAIVAGFSGNDGTDGNTFNGGNCVVALCMPGSFCATVPTPHMHMLDFLCVIQ
mmetsp:Transcript_8539/g.18797  ORF Transcript_8539/g.18797 Transcript_8539/m.18797 type:complete len:86 (+) Transcript_8539:236-493(+)